MRVMSLNVWGGHVCDALLTFIEKHASVDIFCFQELYHNASDKISTDDRIVTLDLFSKIQALLTEHTGYFRPVVDETYGLGMFVRGTLEVLGEGEVCIHENPDYPGKGPAHSRNLQYVTVRKDEQTLLIVNVHGLWNGRGKTDTPARIAQSRKIRAFLDQRDLPTVLCGDFNLRPDTESLQIIEEEMVNLIREHHICSTRTPLYPKEESFADYVLTTPDVQARSFEVLSDVVSDHAPLLLEVAGFSREQARSLSPAAIKLSSLRPKEDGVPS